MATETRGAPWGETRGIHTTAGGIAVTSASQAVPIPNGTRELEFSIRTATYSAVSVLWAVNPSLVILHTADSLATAPTDATNKMRDGIAGNVLVLDSLDTAGNGDFIYVGAKIPFGGVAVNVTAVNGTSSVLTVKYWTGSAWADISDTDGTSSYSKTFAQDGNVTWTTPTQDSTWARTSLKSAGDTSINTFQYATEELYWTRWETSAAFDSEVEVTGMHALSRNTYFSEIFFSDTKKIAVNSSDLTGNTSFEFKTNTGAGNMIINAHAIHNFPTN